jgi:hypothetical protein
MKSLPSLYFFDTSIIMEKYIEKLIMQVTGAKEVEEDQFIQQLWSGYGSIIRYQLTGCAIETVIVKDVSMPGRGNHPRGWNSDLSHRRKVKSYRVETAWYGGLAASCNDDCRIPHCFATKTMGDEVILVLEDLDSSGFPLRKMSVTMDEIEACLTWLANFHATFMGEPPVDLWKNGTYWHLDTRPDELKAMGETDLRRAAGKIDLLLKKCRFQTIVHGDAKLANFCFPRSGGRVAAVDFQYVGGGCGMKDVAYFIGSCLRETECEKMEDQLLEYYFTELKTALVGKGKKVDSKALEAEWRELYPVAWTDFHRFLMGWSPGHWKLNSYSERLAGEVVARVMGSR